MRRYCRLLHTLAWSCICTRKRGYYTASVVHMCYAHTYLCFRMANSSIQSTYLNLRVQIDDWRWHILKILVYKQENDCPQVKFWLGVTDSRLNHNVYDDCLMMVIKWDGIATKSVAVDFHTIYYININNNDDPSILSNILGHIKIKC